MGKKSQNLLRAGWEIISCLKVCHNRIHGFGICFPVRAVFITNPEFHTLSQTEWLVLLALIWKSSLAFCGSLWHLIKVFIFVGKNLYLCYFNWWYSWEYNFFGERVEIMNDTAMCFPALYSGGLYLLITHFWKLEEWRSQKKNVLSAPGYGRLRGGMILFQTLCLDVVTEGIFFCNWRFLRNGHELRLNKKLQTSM